MTGVQAPVSNRWVRVLIMVWSLVGIGLLLAAAGWVMGRVSAALVPFLLAILIVFLFRSPVAALEKRGMKRGTAVALCYLVGLVVFGVALGFLVPALVEQVRQFIVAFPGYYDRANAMLLQWQDKFQTLVVPTWVEDALVNLQDTVTKQSAKWSASLAKEVFSVGGSAVSLLGNGLLAMVVGFWLLKDLPVIKKEAVLLAGPKREQEATVLTAKVSRILGGYLRGQLVISSSTAVLTVIGLSIVGVPYSLVIGMLAGLFNVVPWIGPAITATIAGIAAAFVSPLHIVGALVVCVTAQQITDMVIQPRVMSEQVDLHPLLVIFSLLAGAALFGFSGLVLAIPVAAIGKGLFVYYFEKYTDSKLESEGGALFRARAGEDEGAGSEPACEPDAEADETGSSKESK